VWAAVDKQMFLDQALNRRQRVVESGD